MKFLLGVYCKIRSIASPLYLQTEGLNVNSGEHPKDVNKQKETRFKTYGAKSILWEVLSLFSV